MNSKKADTEIWSYIWMVMGAMGEEVDEYIARTAKKAGDKEALDAAFSRAYRKMQELAGLV